MHPSAAYASMTSTSADPAVDYVEACALEERMQHDEALRLFGRCAERTPGFRDVESRLQRR